jgi:hypothetical protein
VQAALTTLKAWLAEVSPRSVGLLILWVEEALARRRLATGLGPSEELSSKGVLSQARPDAVTGGDEKPCVFEGVGDVACERRRGAGIAGEIRPELEHRNATVIRSGHSTRLGCGAHSPLPLSCRCPLEQGVLDHLDRSNSHRARWLSPVEA